MPLPAAQDSPPPDHAAALALIVALALERRCLRDRVRNPLDSNVVVLQSGPGAANAARAATEAVAGGACALLSIGVAGAVAPRLRSGDVVVPEAVVEASSGDRYGCSQPWTRALRSEARAFADVHAGVLASVPNVLVSAGDKAGAALRYGAVACDMESAAIAAVAARARLPFAAIRVISDTAADELPPDVSSWVDAGGNARISAVLAAMLSPGRWRSIVSMTLQFRTAQRRLRQISARLSASAYRCPRQRAPDMPSPTA